MPQRSLSVRAGFLAFGNGTSAVVQLVVAAILARVLTDVEFGTYKQTYLILHMAGPLVTLGLPSALLYFIPLKKDRGRGVLTETLLILLATGLLFSCGLWFGGARFFAHQFNNPGLETTLNWFALLPVFWVPLLSVSPCLVAAQRPVWVAAYTISMGLVRMALVVTPVLLASTATALIAIQGGVATIYVMLVPALFLMYRAVTTGSLRPTLSGASELVRYATPLGVGAMVGTIHKLTDKYIVSTIVDAGDAAVFFNGAMEIPFVSVLTGSAASVMVPEISRCYSEGRIADGLGIFHRSAVKCGLFLAPLAGWFFISAPWVMTWLYGPTYLASTPIFRIYLLLLPLRVAFFGPLFQAAGRSDLVMVRSIVGFLGNVVLTLILAKLFGPIGAAVGTVLSILLFTYAYCVFAAAKLYHTSPWQILPYGQLSRLFVPIVLIVGLISAASRQIGMENALGGTTQWIALSVVYCVLVLVAYLSLKIMTIESLLRQARQAAERVRSMLP